MATVRKRTWETKDGISTAWLVDYRDGAGRRRFMSFERKKDAEDALAEVTVEVKRGIHTPARDSMTVAEAAEIWMERGESEKLERGTLRNYREHVDKYVVPELGGEKLARLTTPRIEAYKDSLMRTRSRDQAAKILTTLKGILSEAQRRGLVAQNVAQPVKVSVRKRDRRKLEIGRDIPSKEEIRSILDAAEGRWRPLLISAVFTGMRASELRGLRWSDVDFDKKVAHVRQRADYWGDMGSPKSEAGQRQIPLSPMVINALREWKLACPKGEADLVFPNGAGRVELHSNIAHRGFGAIQRRAGMVDEDDRHKYGMHSLRHFCASWLIEQGFAPKRIQEWLGHSSITMTFDRYGHLFPNLEDDHAKLAAGELALVRGGK
jgi:integrase